MREPSGDSNAACGPIPVASPALAGPTLDGARSIATPNAGARWDALLVLVVAWTAHFALFRRFGLYEDDYWIVAEPIAWTWERAGTHVASSLLTLPQGRPIGLILGSMVPFLCFKVGGISALPLVYLLASGIVALNALLAYRLLSAPYGRSVALLAALVLTLYPPDTTRSFLTHALVVQPAMTLVLLALLSYVRGRRVLAYLLAAASLLTYESGMLAFFAAPLLSAKWDRALLRRWAGHLAITLGIVAVVFTLRYFAGEERVANFGGSDIRGDWLLVPSRMLQALGIGPAHTLAAFAKRTGYALGHLGSLHLVLRFAIALPLLWVVFFRRMGTLQPASRAVLLRAAATGAVMFVGGYALEFSRWHFPPIQIDGRLSAVHFGGTVGGSIFVAAIISLLWTLARGWRARAVGAGLTALLIASLWMFGFAVQKGYAATLLRQRAYWARIVELVPDLSARSLVLLVGAEPSVSEFIRVSSWSDPFVLPLLFRGPGNAGPRLIGGDYAFEEGFVEARGGRLWWSSKAPLWLHLDRSAPVQREGVILLEHTDAGWRRRVGSIAIHGVEIPLPPPPGDAKTALEKGPLYALLLGQ
jgi:hypothetical protein